MVFRPVPVKRIALACLVSLAWGFGQTWIPWPDPQSIKSPHPGYDLAVVHPDGFSPSVSGMAFLPDGRLLIATLAEGPIAKGSDQGVSVGQKKGKLWLLDGVGGADRSRVTVRDLGLQFMNPLGLRYADGHIYLIHQHGLSELIDTNKDGVPDSSRLITPFPEAQAEGGCCTWTHGLVIKDGFAYAATAASWPVNPGKVIQIDLKDGTRKFVAEGLRFPNGLGLAPDGEIWIADQQGEWRPSSPLFRFRPGVHYGMGNPNPTAKPNLWLPHGEAALSPSEPVWATSGTFKGQMLLGDTRFDNIHRVFLEKVGGETQGAIFHFSGGVESGVNRMAWGPDGALYMGELGAEGHFTWRLRDTYFGLQRLKPNGKPVFEMLDIRSYAEGFLIQFTLPVDKASVLAAGAFKAESWRYVPNEKYGGPKIDSASNAVKEVYVLNDGKTVFLVVDSLKAGRVVHISHRDDVVSATGLKPWINETWYTLNAIGEPYMHGDFPNALRPGGKAGRVSAAAPFVAVTAEGPVLKVPGPGAHHLELRDVHGRLLARFDGAGPAAYGLGAWRGSLLLWSLRDSAGLRSGTILP